MKKRACKKGKYLGMMPFMKSGPSDEYVLHQWISCGFQLSHAELSPEKNRHWYGSLYSPEGSGGNFLISGHLQTKSAKGFNEQPTFLELDPLELKQGLMVWDNKYLNDFHWESPVLSLEAMANQLMVQVQQHPLPDAIKWSELEIKLDSQRKVRIRQNSSISTFFGFRLRSIIEADDPVGVDVLVELEMSGDQWESQVQRTQAPLGALESWLKVELNDRLYNESLNQWLGVKAVEDIPEAMFRQLKQLVPVLKSVRLCLESRESIAYFG